MNKSKKSESNRICRVTGKERSVVMKVRDSFKNVGVDGRIILKFV